MQNASILYNPLSGRGDATEIARRVKTHCEQNGYKTAQLHRTEYPRHAVEIASSLSDSVERLIVIGGDGTLRQTIEGLGKESSRIQLGLIPTGNANVVARELNIPLQPDKAIELLSTGRSRGFDIGLVNDAIFLCMVGIGYDAQVVAGVGTLRSTRIGRWIYQINGDLIYLLVGASCLLRPVYPKFRLLSDGKTFPDEYHAAIIANTRTYAKGWCMVPDAHPNDGLLHYQARKRGGLPYVAWSLWAASRAKKLPRSVSHYGSGKDFHIEFDRQINVQVDGDPWGATQSLHIRIAPAKFNMLCPATPDDAIHDISL